MRDGSLCLLVQGNLPARVLLGFKKQGFGAGKWGGFGGKIEPGETLETTAVREVKEEAGIIVAAQDLNLVAHLTFVFPYRQDWSQVVHVFVAERWRGEPTESDEMKPAWFRVANIPYTRMWQDGVHWLPRVLAGERIRARFTFHADNETVDEVYVESWDGDLAGQHANL